MPKNDNMLAILWMLNSGTKITAKPLPYGSSNEGA
jgi:hypothetical protein